MNSPSVMEMLPIAPRQAEAAQAAHAALDRMLARPTMSNRRAAMAALRSYLAASQYLCCDDAQDHIAP